MHQPRGNGPEEQVAAVALAVGVYRSAQPWEGIGPGLGLVQDHQVITGGQALPFEVKAQALGLLFEVEVGAPERPGERGLAALAGAHECNGRVGGQAVEYLLMGLSGYHVLYYRN